MYSVPFYPIPGGYIDPIQGTAVLTLPVHSEGGGTGVARVEAEAEWAQEWAAGAVEPEKTERSIHACILPNLASKTCAFCS